MIRPVAGEAQRSLSSTGSFSQEVTNGHDPHASALRDGCLLRRNFFAEGGPLNSATMISSPAVYTAALDRAVHCARVAEDNKAQDIVVLDMRGVTPLFDFLVLATGASRRQIHTLAEEIDAAMRGFGDSRASIEGYHVGKWVVQDYGDVVVHVFDRDSRSYYGLEDLWADAPHLPWQRL
jgi:ribosome-associated protein